METKTKTLVACLFACAVWAHCTSGFAQAVQSSQADSPADPATDAPPQEVVAASDVVEPEPDTELESGSETPGAPMMGTAAELPPTATPDVGISRLEDDLRMIEAERDQYSRFWPWFTLTSGVALTVGSVAVGAAHVFGCDGGCSTSAWIGGMVAAGTFVATLGTIWVVNSNVGLAEIDSRRYHLEQEIERIRVSANLPNKSDYRAGSPLISMRFALR